MILSPSLLFAALAVAPGAWFVSAIPMQYTIAQRATECLYEKLDANEKVTMSVFITGGSELKGTAIFEGPIAPPAAETGKDIQDGLTKYQMGERYGTGPKGRMGNIMEENVVNFEEAEDWDDDDDDDWDDDDDVDDDDVADDDEDMADMTPQQKLQRKRRIEAYKKRREEARKKRMARRQKSRPTEGEPHQKTYVAKNAGWYRACMRASWYQVGNFLWPWLLPAIWVILITVALWVLSFLLIIFSSFHPITPCTLLDHRRDGAPQSLRPR
mmetsp:Transcript_41016/g.123783  ORF Transcript_41016/g.123783 Transcript_41016/m.123783 type:complete len:270 (-) Transcript_41016:719-1528(-)